MARIAAAQHGVVTRGQLLRAAVTRREIESRLRTGALLKEHRGIYRVGHRAPSTEATYLAAVFAAGEEAVLCGHAAAYLWGLLKGASPPAEVLGPTERRIEGVRMHRCRELDARDVTIFNAIPVTTVARTAVDLAAGLSDDGLARACHEAGVRYGLTPSAVVAVLARRPNAPGARKLRRIVEGEVKVTLSALESRFLRLLENEGLPLPETNRPAGVYRVACRWPGYGLTVELDSYRFHNSRHSWEQDRRREREARARGDDFRRFSYGDVFEHPRPMLHELSTCFRARRPG